jgi:hypothetical protein
MKTTLRTSLLILFAMNSAAFASDHFDAPALKGMGDLDIADLYAFQSPTNPDNSVLIMTVNPFAGVVSGSEFRPGATYDIRIDNTGDAVADLTYSASFTGMGDSQSLSLSLNGATVATGAVGVGVSVGVGGGMVQAGLFDDPFFFDLAGFENGLMFTGDDTIAGSNISAIILEVPSSELGGPNIGVWATTSVAGAQVDRAGRPAINTVLIPSDRKNEFNQTSPADDPGLFAADVQGSIESLNGGDVAHASAVTSILLPDVLTFDTTNAAGFLNGRQLADDVIDAELTLLTNSMTPVGDGVDANDLLFPGTFPYLAPAHVPEPSGLALVAFGLPFLTRLRRRLGRS